MLCRLSLSCREFRRRHVEYVDGLLAENLRRLCDLHVDQCRNCRRHNISVRRALLALQALPAIAPSPLFGRRLCARLAHDTGHRTPLEDHHEWTHVLRCIGG